MNEDVETAGLPRDAILKAASREPVLCPGPSGRVAAGEWHWLPEQPQR